MADIAKVGAKIGNARPNISVVVPLVAAEEIDRGEAVYVDTNGKAALADASSAGTAVCVGIALQDVAAGQSVDILVMGMVSGFTISGLAYGALVKVSDTAGALDNGGSPTVSAPVGRVFALSDGDRSKVLFVNCLHNLNVVPA